MELQKNEDVSSRKGKETDAKQMTDLVYGDARVTIDARERISVNGMRVELTSREQMAFMEMARHPGEIISKERFYGLSDPRMTNEGLKVLISKLRKKLGCLHPDARELIETVFNKGFRIIAHGEACSVNLCIKHRIELDEGELTIDQYDQAYVDGTCLNLTPSEAALLALHASTPGMIWTKRAVMRSLYKESPGEGPGIKILDVFICKVNKKFEALFPEKTLIRPIWGRGQHVGTLTRDADADITATPLENQKIPGPKGGRISSADLPESGVRWVASRKATIIALVEKGIVPLPYVLALYPGLTKGEYAEWRQLALTYGLPGLRTTKKDMYRIR